MRRDETRQIDGHAPRSVRVPRLLTVGVAATLAATLAGVTAVTLAAATPDASAPAEVVNLTMWRYDSPVDTPHIEQAVAEWNAANPGIQVTFESIPYNEYYGSALTTAFASGTGPDLFSQSPARFMDYVNNGLAAPLDDILEDYKDDFLPGSLEASTVNGQIYALPYEAEPVALFYNEDMLNEAGIEPPTTWDELTAAARALKTDERAGVIIELVPGAYQNFAWYPFLWGGGGDVVNGDWTASTMGSDEAAAALDLWGSYVAEGLSPSQLPQQTFDAGFLGRGETAIQSLGSWAIGQMASEFPDVNYGIVPIPHAEGQEAVSVSGGSRQMVNAKSAHVEEAKKFARWLWLENEWFPQGWSCGWRTELAHRKSIQDACAGQGTWADPHIAYMVENIVPIAQAEPRYPNDIVQAVSDAIQAVMFGGQTGHEAGAEAAAKIDNFLSTYEGFH